MILEIIVLPLNYSLTFLYACLARLELTTFGSVVRRSIQLSYRHINLDYSNALQESLLDEEKNSVLRLIQRRI